jgi:hypothetical protein
MHLRVSWLCRISSQRNYITLTYQTNTIPAIDSYTLISLHRAYTTLSIISTLSSPPPPPPPTHTHIHTTRNPDRHLTHHPSHLHLAHALFPFMGHLYADDWDDLERMGRGVYFGRVVLGDRRAGRGWRGDGGGGYDERSEKGKGKLDGFKTQEEDKRLAFAPAFTLPAPPGWWLPARNTLLDLFDLPRDSTHAWSWSWVPFGSWFEFGSGADAKTKRRGVTYVSVQSRAEHEGGGGGGGRGPWVREADHDLLVRGLERLGREVGVDVWVVDAEGGAGGSVDEEVGGKRQGRGEWKEGVKAALQSNVSRLCRLWIFLPMCS